MAGIQAMLCVRAEYHLMLAWKAGTQSLVSGIIDDAGGIHVPSTKTW
jgi:hypothetical protein